MPAVALQDKKSSLVIQLSRDLDLRLNQVTRPSRQFTLLWKNWLFAFLSHSIARVMLLNKKIPQKFWGEAVNTSCHIGNRIYFRGRMKKTAHEIWNGKKTKVSISEYSKTSATFSMIGKILRCLMLKVMKVSSLGILQVAEHTKSTTREQRQ